MGKMNTNSNTGLKRGNTSTTSQIDSKTSKKQQPQTKQQAPAKAAPDASMEEKKQKQTNS